MDGSGLYGPSGQLLIPSMLSIPVHSCPLPPPLFTVPRTVTVDRPTGTVLENPWVRSPPVKMIPERASRLQLPASGRFKSSSSNMAFTLGIDYRTNFVRAVVVACFTGQEIGSKVVYPNGKQGVLIDSRDPNLARAAPRRLLHWTREIR